MHLIILLFITFVLFMILKLFSKRCTVCGAPIKRTYYTWTLDGKREIMCPRCNGHMERKVSKQRFTNFAIDKGIELPLLISTQSNQSILTNHTNHTDKLQTINIDSNISSPTLPIINYDTNPTSNSPDTQIDSISFTDGILEFKFSYKHNTFLIIGSNPKKYNKAPCVTFFNLEQINYFDSILNKIKNQTSNETYFIESICGRFDLTHNTNKDIYPYIIHFHDPTDRRKTGFYFLSDNDKINKIQLSLEKCRTFIDNNKINI
jgi:hypothetical protein